MELMVVAIVIIVLVALGGAIAFALRRRSDTELHSVEGYRHTLDTLEGIRTRESSHTVRVLGVPEATTREAVLQEPPRGPQVPREEHLVFDDVAPQDRPFTGSGMRSSNRGQGRAVARMNQRPRRLGGPLVVGAVVVAVILLLAFLGARHVSHHSNAAATAPTTTHGATPTTARSTATSAHGATATTVKKNSNVTTTTAAPLPYTATVVSAHGATFVPLQSSYTLTLAATTGACWIDVTQGGSTLFVGTIAQGAQQVLPATGTAQISVGALGALSANLDGGALVIPNGAQAPYTITLSPAPPPTTTTTAPGSSSPNSPTTTQFPTTATTR
jgi:Domain of unknown function (DUF4115)